MALTPILLKILNYLHIFAWVVVMGAAFRFRSIFEDERNGWMLVLMGGFFMVIRQILAIVPWYATSDTVLLLRFIVGVGAAIFLLLGFMNLYIGAKE